MFDSLRRLDIPLAALYFGIFGVVLFMLTVGIFTGMLWLCQKVPILALIPVVAMPFCYLGIFIAYGKAHEGTEYHDTSVDGFQFWHALVVTIIVLFAIFPGNKIELKYIIYTGSFISTWYYLNFIGLCLSVWKRPPWTPIVNIFVYILMIILCVNGVIA